MRLALALAAALGLATVSGAGVTEVHAQDTASFNDKFTVAVSRAGSDLNITVEGKKVDGNDWYVNRDYPIKLTLSAGAATLGKAELTKDDATFEGTEKAGKAKKASFKTTINGADKAKVSYKLVVCSDNSCSPPIKGEITEP
jgi:hypothetical protein